MYVGRFYVDNGNNLLGTNGTNDKYSRLFTLRERRFTKSGAPILPNLRRYQALVEDPVWLCGAVKYYSCALAALYLW